MEDCLYPLLWGGLLIEKELGKLIQTDKGYSTKSFRGQKKRKKRNGVSQKENGQTVSEKKNREVTQLST